MSLLLSLGLLACTKDEPVDSAPDVIDVDQDGYAEDEDCNDNDASINPAADETCNEVDDDCDGDIDEDAVDATAYLIDADGDGFGSDTYTALACDGAPSGYTDVEGDCDDLDATVYPEAEELCDGLDNDCDDSIDEDLEGSTYYADTDGDGYGDLDNSTELCDIAEGWVEDSSDCDDADADISPDAEEVCGDGIDNDCDGTANDCSLSDELLATEARTVLLGESAGDQFGGPAKNVGDLNSNGLPELAVSARGSDLSEDGAGAVYLFSRPLDAGTLSASSRDAVILGEGENDQLFTVAGVGDSNGDGSGDLFVGAKNNDDGGSNAGKIYFMQGPFSGEVSVADAEASWTGVAEGDQAGTMSVGDLDGDGNTDVMIAAQKNDDGGNNAGALFVLYGPFGSWMGDKGLYSADAILRGETGDQAAGGLSFAGDVNGDGVGDLLAGAPYADAAGDDGGLVYLVHGPVSGVQDFEDRYDGRFVANSEGDQVGWGLSGTGDLDGDGVDDWMVNAQRDDIREDNANEGSVYIVTANADDFEDDFDLDDSWLRIQGVNTEDKLASVNGGGDMDGDGHIDLVVATRFHDAGGEDSGAAWVIYGPVTGGVVDLEDIAGVRIDGKAAGDGLGAPAGLIGDANSDGYEELAIGARWNDDAGEDAGAAYIFRGSGL